MDDLLAGRFAKYRDAPNTPAFLHMLPPVAGMKGLDLGCGEGTNTRAVARLGASRAIGDAVAKCSVVEVFSQLDRRCEVVEDFHQSSKQ